MICFHLSLAHFTISTWLALLWPKGFLAVLQPRPQAPICGLTPAGILGLPCPPAVVLKVSAQKSAPDTPCLKQQYLPPCLLSPSLTSYTHWLMCHLSLTPEREALQTEPLLCRLLLAEHPQCLARQRSLDLLNI